MTEQVRTQRTVSLDTRATARSGRKHIPPDVVDHLVDTFEVVGQLPARIKPEHAFPGEKPVNELIANFEAAGGVTGRLMPGGPNPYAGHEQTVAQQQQQQQASKDAAERVRERNLRHLVPARSGWTPKSKEEMSNADVPTAPTTPVAGAVAAGSEQRARTISNATAGSTGSSRSARRRAARKAAKQRRESAATSASMHKDEDLFTSAYVVPSDDNEVDPFALPTEVPMFQNVNERIASEHAIPRSARGRGNSAQTMRVSEVFDDGSTYHHNDEDDSEGDNDVFYDARTSTRRRRGSRGSGNGHRGSGHQQGAMVQQVQAAQARQQHKQRQSHTAPPPPHQDSAAVAGQKEKLRKRGPAPPPPYAAASTPARSRPASTRSPSAQRVSKRRPSSAPAPVQSTQIVRYSPAPASAGEDRAAASPRSGQRAASQPNEMLAKAKEIGRNVYDALKVIPEGDPIDNTRPKVKPRSELRERGPAPRPSSAKRSQHTERIGDPTVPRTQQVALYRPELDRQHNRPATWDMKESEREVTMPPTTLPPTRHVQQHGRGHRHSQEQHQHQRHRHSSAVDEEKKRAQAEWAEYDGRVTAAEQYRIRRAEKMKKASMRQEAKVEKDTRKRLEGSSRDAVTYDPVREQQLRQWQQDRVARRGNHDEEVALNEADHQLRYVANQATTEADIDVKVRPRSNTNDSLVVQTYVKPRKTEDRHTQERKDRYASRVTRQRVVPGKKPYLVGQSASENTEPAAKPTSVIDVMGTPRASKQQRMKMNVDGREALVEHHNASGQRVTRMVYNGKRVNDPYELLETATRLATSPGATTAASRRSPATPRTQTVRPLTPGATTTGSYSGTRCTLCEGKTTTCSICFEAVRLRGPGSTRSVAVLACRHAFHLDCIGAAFNAEGRMICPNCRHEPRHGQWLYADGRPYESESSDEFSEDDGKPGSDATSSGTELRDDEDDDDNSYDSQYDSESSQDYETASATSEPREPVSKVVKTAPNMCGYCPQSTRRYASKQALRQHIRAKHGLQA